MNLAVDVSNVVLQTKRLTLRPFCQDDLDDFYNYACKEGVGEMAGWLHHQSKDDSQKILDDFIANKKTFALVYQSKVISSLGIEEYDESCLPELADKKARELGYVLSKDYWGKGLMAEAVKEVCRYLFEIINLEVIVCGYFKRNSQSKRVQEKCGFYYLKDYTYHTYYGATEEAIINILDYDKWKREAAD